MEQSRDGGEQLAIARPRKKNSAFFAASSFFLHGAAHHLRHHHHRLRHGLHGDGDPCKEDDDDDDAVSQQEKLRHSHSKLAPRYWTLLLLLAFLGALLLFPPHLSSTTLLLRTSPSSPSPANAQSMEHDHHHQDASDFTLAGLIAEESDTEQCKSRGEIHRYRSKQNLHHDHGHDHHHDHHQKKPSAHLVRKLREYEERHRRCGPGTRAFERRAKLLKEALGGESSKESDRGAESSEQDAESSDRGAESSDRGAESSDRDAESSKEEDGDEEEDCKYVVWIANSGLGNRLISIAASFVYSLLTGRVLLLGGEGAAGGMGELVCEPFPGRNVTWLMPIHLAEMAGRLGGGSGRRFGRDLQKGSVGSVPKRRRPETERPGPPEMSGLEMSGRPKWPPPDGFSYVHLMHDYGFFDKLFFCGDEQRALAPVPWLVLRSNLYFVPSLHLYVPEFREELRRLFPEPEASFHHVARYLFAPSDAVWTRVVQLHGQHLAGGSGSGSGSGLGFGSGSSRRLGVQVRTFAHPPIADPKLAARIVACAVENGALPPPPLSAAGNGPLSATANGRRLPLSATPNGRRLPLSARTANGRPDPAPDNSAFPDTSVVVTSLLPDYYHHISSLYSAPEPAASGPRVWIGQPSHEIHQNSDAPSHNAQAWAEMCLLSLCDELITSPMSTFGYVAAGMAGIRPLILLAHSASNGGNSSDGSSSAAPPPCSRALSMDPCFHAPPYYECDRDRGGDTSRVLPYVRHCPDVDWGLQLFPIDPTSSFE